MPQRNGGTETAEKSAASAEKNALGGGKLWVGQHSGDQDILVLDPAETDSSAPVLALYSLTQHRMRSFPRETVIQKIPAIEDSKAKAKALKDYAARNTLRAGHEEALASARSERKDRQRKEVVKAHKRHIEALGLEYKGERETEANHKTGRRTKCHSCGIQLDDFASAVCGICDGVLCSCGACACGSPSRSKA